MNHKPILPGFHPDPSVCRVGDEYFLATSTFEYVPGVPIYRSTDLMTWDLVGHAVPDEDEVAAGSGASEASSGIFAPTLRHHDGRFWMTTTSIGRIGEGQLITHADHPAGPWSTPVRVPGTPGIDPDLSWDDEGRCLLTWRGSQPGGIHQVQIDPFTGEPQEEARYLAPEHPSPRPGNRACRFRRTGGWELGRGVPRYSSIRVVSRFSCERARDIPCRGHVGG
ncbi:beta-xylosidase [Microbacterium amylolyticum]|uniref:Beta-xylosidase n=1 Tax=Microbacterium amylolyticum TaxID=936337 RepID=A0ABS4ZGZ2_9MICO|nr:family 43 glycosylhydrolase [Microbacterium amylolyticum]MBP2436550.1 beta-xylosidase [Microbacterium amylolyticum]